MIRASRLRSIGQLAAIGLLASIGNCIAAGQADPRLYGTWDLFEIQGNGMTAQVRLTIEYDRVVNSSRCSFQNKQVQAQTVSAAVITKDRITILEESVAQQEYEPGFLQCRVSLERGNIDYHLVNDKLVLQMAGQDQTVELSRSGSVFVQARQLAGMNALAAQP